jgi:ribosomal protein S18 acetylase RimI-like enzyme
VTDPASAPITIRPATAGDAERIVRAYLDSAEHHARLDPERYLVPSAETVATRYREGSQHLPGAAAESATFVAEAAGAIVGFVDVRLDRSHDAMHRPITYCHIVEIAVVEAHRSGGIGARLLEAGEAWGRARGATFASLEYLIANARAAEFYQRRMGYHTAAITAIKRL